MGKCKRHIKTTTNNVRKQISRWKQCKVDESKYQETKKIFFMLGDAADGENKWADLKKKN